jgi:hypothetical protein
MAFLRLNQKLQRVEVEAFEIDNAITFSFFDRIPADDRETTFLRALYIGVLALQEDRLSSFLSKTANELGTELESLKIIFDLKQELFFKTAIKGLLAEDEIATFLNQYFEGRRLRDRAHLTGNSAGLLPKNKTGDIVCTIDGRDDLKVVIECKFDKSIKLGDPEKRDLFARRADTVWSQLLEASANRDGKVALIVLDRSLVDATILNEVDDVGFIPSVGFIAVVDTQRGNFSNLIVAYGLARNIALNAKEPIVDFDFLQVLIKRVMHDLRLARDVEPLIKSNIENCKSILASLQRSTLSMEFTVECLQRFLQTGKVTRDQMLEFYMAEAAKDRFRALETEIKGL